MLLKILVKPYFQCIVEVNQIHAVYRKDVKLPVQMQRAMAAEAEAGREARGKIVAAEGELKASQALKEASDIMSNNPLTLQVPC